MKLESLLSLYRDGYDRVHIFNFIKITNIFADICGIKSAGSSKIILLSVWVLRKILTDFTHF